MAKRVDAQLAGGALSARQPRDALAAGESLSPVIIVMCDQGRLVRWGGKEGWRSAPSIGSGSEMTGSLPAMR